MRRTYSARALPGLPLHADSECHGIPIRRCEARYYGTMKIVIAHRDLNAALRAAIMASHGPLSGHDTLLIEANEDASEVKLSSTDADAFLISTTVGARVDEPGQVALPGRLITDFVASLPSSDVTIESGGHGGIVAVSCDRNRGSISHVDPARVATWPMIDPIATVHVDRDSLVRGLRDVLPAVDSSGMRPILSGVLLRFDGDRLQIAATDGIHLATSEASILQSDFAGSEAIVVPPQPLDALTKLDDDSLSVTFTLDDFEHRVLITSGRTHILSKLLSGDYPPYAPLLDLAHPTTIAVPVSDLRRELRSAAVFARDGDGGAVRINASVNGNDQTGHLDIEARARDVGNAVAAIEAHISGPEAHAVFNCRYLMDAVGAMEDGDVIIEIHKPTDPGLVRGRRGTVHVIMPMSVEWPND